MEFGESSPNVVFAQTNRNRFHELFDRGNIDIRSTSDRGAVIEIFRATGKQLHYD